MNLGILFGGNSLEHEISIISAYSLKKKLEQKYSITMIYINHQNEVFDATRAVLNDFKNHYGKKLRKTRFQAYGIRKKKIDCMVLCQHGENGEDGMGAALCRFYKIPFVGSDLLPSSISMNKMASYEYLSKNGIPMLQTKLYSYRDFIDGKKPTEFPCILKPINGGSSIGIIVCKTIEEFDDMMLKAFQKSQEYIVQPYIENLTEYNLAIYEEGYSNLEKIDKKDEIFSFENKYNESFKLMHQTLQKDEEYSEFVDIARRTYSLLKCSGIIRIDFFKIKEKIYLNEVNILPGALAMYLFDDFDEVIQKCIYLAINKKRIQYEQGTFLKTSSINK